MDNKTIILLAIAFIIGGTLMWFVRGCTIPKPQPIPPPTIKEHIIYVPSPPIHDTVYKSSTKPKPKDTTKTIPDFNYTYKTHGVKDSCTYDINLALQFVKDSVLSKLVIDILPPSTKIDTVTITVYPPPLPPTTIDRPFYANIWFYATVVVTAVGTYALYVIAKVR